MRLSPIPALLALALAGAGCSTTQDAAVIKPQEFSNYKNAPRSSGGPTEDGGYKLTERESGLDCKKLTGLMMLRINVMRDMAKGPQPSAPAKAMQSAAHNVLGFSNIGNDPKADAERERRRLDTINNALAGKGCKTVDIDAALVAPIGSLAPTKDAAAKK